MNKVYEIVGGEIDYISLVQIPAITRYFKVVGDRIIAPVIIPDMLIYRQDADGNEYYVRWSAEGIKKSVAQFNYKCGNVFNLFHDEELVVDRWIEIYGLFIIDSAMGITPPLGFNNIPNGALFADIRIISAEVLDKIKRGELNGFSVEGTFEMVLLNGEQNDVITFSTIPKILQDESQDASQDISQDVSQSTSQDELQTQN